MISGLVTYSYTSLIFFDSRHSKKIISETIKANVENSNYLTNNNIAIKIYNTNPVYAKLENSKASKRSNCLKANNTSSFLYNIRSII